MSNNPVKSRRAAREAAFQAVYQCVQGGEGIDRAVLDALDRQEFSEEMQVFVRTLASGAVTKVGEIDACYACYLKEGWIPDRLAVTDRIALRIAVFELWHQQDTPPKVVISEAVNLAKKFGSDESGRFVNGVLARVLEDSPKKDWPAVSAVGESQGDL